MKFLYHDRVAFSTRSQLRVLDQALKNSVEQTRKETTRPEVCFATFVFASIWSGLGYPFWKLGDWTLNAVSMNSLKAEHQVWSLTLLWRQLTAARRTLAVILSL